MLLFKIVFRNLCANHRKNLIVFTVSACVCLFLFLFLSFSDGELSNIRNGVSSFFQPWTDIRAAAPEYRHLKERAESTREETIGDTAALLTELNAMPFVHEATAVVFSSYANLYTGGKKYLNFNFLPLDPYDTTLRTKYRIVDGHDLAKDSTGEIIIHKAVRKTIPLHVGDTVTIAGNDFFDQVSTITVTIAGFFEPVLDNPNLYNLVLIPTADKAVFSGYEPDEANRIDIRLKHGTNPKEALESLRRWPSGADQALDFWSTSEEKNKNVYESVFRMVRLIIVAVSLITLFITSFGIMNVISTNLYERRREIGTYYCLGTEPPFLMAAYTMEIFIINCAGAVTGIAGGLVIRAVINAIGFTSEEPGFQIVAGGSRLYLGFSLSTIFWILGGICVITVVTALTTLGKALRVSPVVAIKETE